jgi:hypothetical protein
MDGVSQSISVGDVQTDCLSFQGMVVAYIRADGVPPGRHNSVVALPVSSLSLVT